MTDLGQSRALRVESPDSPLELPELEICERYEKIFTAAVSDLLRENMLTQQILPNGTIPLRDRQRDVDKVLEPGFPPWVRYRNSSGMLGRFRISGRQTQIRIGNVFIEPGDLIFADIDGVIVFPRAICVSVLLRAKEIANGESQPKKWKKGGMSATEIVKRGGFF